MAKEVYIAFTKISYEIDKNQLWYLNFEATQYIIENKKILDSYK